MNENYFVYLFEGRCGEPLYVGLTKSIDNRIKQQHFSSNSHLDDNCLFEVEKIFYHQCRSRGDMKIKERYLINKLNPKFNQSMNNEDDFDFVIDVNWENYSFDKKALLDKRQKNNIKKSKLKFKNHICKIEKSERSRINVNTCYISDLTYLRKQYRFSRFGITNAYNYYFVSINDVVYVTSNNDGILSDFNIRTPIGKREIKYLNNAYNLSLSSDDFIRVYNTLFLSKMKFNFCDNNFVELVRYDIVKGLIKISFY